MLRGQALVARTIIAVLLSVILGVNVGVPARAQNLSVLRPGDKVPDQYIVVFKDSVASPAAVARNMAGTLGLSLRHTYTVALKGFSAVIPPARLNAVRSDPRVRYAVPNMVDQIYQQQLPTGVDRIDADLNPAAIGSPPVTVNADVAIIDTGIDLTHPDLNVVDHVSFAGGDGNDKNGHGTHVSGTVGAIDNNIGVVGVAPGVRLHAVQVCKPGGLCFRDAIVAGIDYVTAHADQIAVANMSLGGTGSDDGNCGLTNNDPEHEAICNAVAAGVVFVVAAGNESDDAANHVPAAYDEVITVSALSDFDGAPGGSGAPTCRSDEDDSFANFSNYGLDVDIMAPGVCITSTWKDGGYNTISGTSMATPHVTGAVALYVAKNGKATNALGVQAIRDALVASGSSQSGPCGLTVQDDPDTDAEPILNANAVVLGGDGSCQQPVAYATDAAVTGLSAPASVTQGNSLTVSVTVANKGTGGPADISVNLVDSSFSDFNPQSSTVTLDAGQSTTVNFDFDTTSWTLGTHDLTATAVLSGDENPGNNSLTTSVAVNSLPLTGGTMWVGDIALGKKGPNLNATVSVTSDSGPVAGASVDSVLLTYDANGDKSFDPNCIHNPSNFNDTSMDWCWDFSALTTDSNGQTKYKLLHAPTGLWQFEVLGLTDSTLTWDHNSDVNNPRVGNY